MSYNPIQSEEEILTFWQEQDIYAKSKAQGKGKKPFYFLDGPPYTSGKVHLGTAWNKTLKDIILRYKRMQGFDVWDRAGYDMHGLPTEHATEKKLGLHGKIDIEKFGVDKFVKACKELCIENMQIMNKQFARLGVWMDFENPYQSIKKDYIEGIWWLIKTAHQKKRLYEGLRTMTWCPSCATALAKHECEYQEVTDKSIFVKLKLKDQKNTYLIVWTTTPWTIPFNLAVMVNSDLLYQKCRVKTKNGEEKWILSKALAGPVIQSIADLTFEVEEEFKGEQLKGIKYIHPLRKELIEYRKIEVDHKNAYTVVLSKEYVDTTAGSGLVHCAPGCGPEDYEVGVQNDLPAFNPLDEHGIFPKNMGSLSGLKSKTDDKLFIKKLEEMGAIVAIVPIKHDYAHCWRCHNPVIFRATKQWFFKVEDLKEKMIKENDQISWMPKAGYNAFDSWLKNLRDNSITKQRYWGVPLPVWKCDSCESYEVVGSAQELAQFIGKENVPDELHKPWIDDISWACACKGEMKRIPDILDVWVDSGSASWNGLGFPKTKEQFDKLFPADFILEGKDQIRGWFNLLHVASILAFDKPAFKACYMHGFINDSQGRKMSKSVGNYILPEEVIEKYGANTLRYYVAGAANPGLDMSYNFEDVELKHRNLNVFWNIQNLLLELAKQVPYPTNPKLTKLDNYMQSRLHSTIQQVTAALDEYRPNEAPLLIESLLLDLSRTYIQFSRDLMNTGSKEEKGALLYTLATTYLQAMKLFSPIAPMFAEQVYQNLKDTFNLKEQSIHLCTWPIADKNKINKQLETQFSLLGDAAAAILATRDLAKLGVRWPAVKVILKMPKESEQLLKDLEHILKQHVNVKEIIYGDLDGVTYQIQPNYKTLGKTFGAKTAQIATKLKNANIAQEIKEHGKAQLDGEEITKEHVTLSQQFPDGWVGAHFSSGTAYLDTTLTSELESEGFAREIIRRSQQLRKDAGLQKQDVIVLGIHAPELIQTLKTFANEIKERAGAKDLQLSILEDSQQQSSTKIKGKQINLSLKKI